MQLILSVQNTEFLSGITTPTFTFDGEGGTIGRGDQASWQIDDKSHLVSNIHGEVELVDGAFCYTDRSTNGTLVNGAKVSMSWNEAVRLSDGDTMTLGEVQIAVQVIASDDETQAASRNFLGDAKGANAKREQGQSDEMSVDDLVPERADASRASNDIVGDVPPFGEIKMDYDIATKSADPLRALEDTNDALVGVVDPIKAFGREDGSTQTQHQSLVDTPAARDVDQESLRDLSGTTADAFGAGQTGNTSVDADLDSYLRVLEEQEMDTAAQTEAGEAYANSHEPLDHIALAPLGRGLGYDVSRVDRAGADLLMEEVGEALSAAVDKLWTMSQPSEDKGPLARRLAETKLYPHEDNPLRFSHSSKSALKALFDRTNPVQLTAGAAVAETLGQIERHQDMSEKSIDEALELVFAAMSPTFMKRRFAAYASARKQSTDLSPAECWQLYERYFAELKSDRQTGLRRLFWQIFDRRYDELAREASLDLAGD